MVTENKRLKSAYDTAANWTSGNPTLLPGEIGIESDTKNIKVGDGSTAWNSLAYTSMGVTARNTSTGRLAIGGIEMGDTGRRNLTGTTFVPAGIASFTNPPIICRNGNIVTISIDATADTSNVFTTGTIPVGFRPGNLISFLWYTVSGVTRRGYLNDTGQIYWELLASTRYVMSISYYTNSAWPTSLPGTAV